MIQLTKTDATTTFWKPLEEGSIAVRQRDAARVLVWDAMGRCYVDAPLRGDRSVAFAARGAVGRHLVEVVDARHDTLDMASFTLQARTAVACNAGPYANLMTDLQQMIERDHETKPWIINGNSYYMLVCWSRDHVYTLKAAKYFIEDVQSGLDYWLDSQLPNGMFWDCIYPNTENPAPSWLGEALGEGWFKYDNGMKYIVRRVPVLADTEYVFTEGVWYAWKATGDDAWMSTQLPRLEKALEYMTSDPLRWSRKEGLMRRSFTADEWDFANPHYCAGDHRCIYPQDPRFLFHGNQSGLYATYWRMAEMYEHLGNAGRAKELRAEGEALRRRANKRLFFGTQYGHMIPEAADPKEVYAQVGDERKRMSLSTGYTINRGLPTHAMAVKILDEYQRRAKVNKRSSFAEWWTMDPPYSPSQWPSQHTGTAGCPEGEYMNGGICTIIAGEVAKAAFDHGREAYGVDILERVWNTAERDGGNLHQVYRRLPEKATLPKTRFSFVDLRSVVNRGLCMGATEGVEAWTGEGSNDMRNLPVGRQRFGAIEFDVVDPASNGGRAVLRLEAAVRNAPVEVTVPVGGIKARSLYFLHALARSAGRGVVVGAYDVCYADGAVYRIHVRDGREVGLWWGCCEQNVDRAAARRAWWGPNPEWKNVGLFMFGWNNPRPEQVITAIRLAAIDPRGQVVDGAGAELQVCETPAKPTGPGGLLVAGISASDQPVAFEPKIRSYGLPDCWAQAAVYYAIAEGLAGVEDAGTTFSDVKIAPRWALSQADEAAITLHYPASGGYCSYRYTLDKRRRRIELDVTGSFRRASVHCLLPGRAAAKDVSVSGKALAFTNAKVEASRYVDFVLDELPKGPVVIRY